MKKIIKLCLFTITLQITNSYHAVRSKSQCFTIELITFYFNISSQTLLFESLNRNPNEIHKIILQNGVYADVKNDSF